MAFSHYSLVDISPQKLYDTLKPYIPGLTYDFLAEVLQVRSSMVSESRFIGTTSAIHFAIFPFRINSLSGIRQMEQM